MKVHDGRGWIDCPQTYCYAPCPPRPPVLGSRSMRGQIEEWSFDPMNPYYLPPQASGAPTPTPVSNVMVPVPGLRVPFRRQRAVTVAGETIARAVKDVPIAYAAHPKEMNSVAKFVAQNVEQQVATMAAAMSDGFAKADRDELPMTITVPDGVQGMGQAASIMAPESGPSGSTPWWLYAGAGVGGIWLFSKIFRRGRSVRRGRRRRAVRAR